jgi:2'-5' RNA ligase
MEVASMVSGKGGLTLSLDLVGSFGHGAGWLGCRELPQRLVRLRNELDDVLHAFDNLVTESVTNVFRPHVTVLRDMRQPTDAVSIMPVYWPITDFALVHSELGHVPRYRIVKAYPLRC